MTRINLLLLVAVMVSALFLVRTQYESRRLFVEVDKAQAESKLKEEKAKKAEKARLREASAPSAVP